jgi:hypothetical protein
MCPSPPAATRAPPGRSHRTPVRRGRGRERGGVTRRGVAVPRSRRGKGTQRRTWSAGASSVAHRRVTTPSVAASGRGGGRAASAAADAHSEPRAFATLSPPTPPAEPPPLPRLNAPHAGACLRPPSPSHAASSPATDAQSPSKTPPRASGNAQTHRLTSSSGISNRRSLRPRLGCCVGMAPAAGQDRAEVWRVRGAILVGRVVRRPARPRWSRRFRGVARLRTLCVMPATAAGGAGAATHAAGAGARAARALLRRPHGARMEAEHRTCAACLQHMTSCAR